ncbi:MAG TPA: T9SS type A sorting domain-containing protein, partial [Chitinophagaceae bacterium]|nr:T9SS type A sorting domain-containing protein [Chitinophagaceae bacterium]
RNFFTLKIQGNSKGVIQLRVLDVSGRVVETKTGITVNTTFHFGNNLPAGVYFIEVTQGKQRQIVKLIRQS